MGKEQYQLFVVLIAVNYDVKGDVLAPDIGLTVDLGRSYFNAAVIDRRFLLRYACRVEVTDRVQCEVYKALRAAPNLSTQGLLFHNPSADSLTRASNNIPFILKHSSTDSHIKMSSGSLAGKIAIITGASKGIGKATALRLAKDGASIVINYSSDAAPADELVKTIGAGRALAIQADVSKVAEIEKLVKQTVDKFGKIDILVANAAIAPNKDLEHTTEEEFDAVMALNVKGPYFLCQVCLFLTIRISRELTVSAESRSPHASWLPCRPPFHLPLHELRRSAPLPLVHHFQRGRRADEPRHVQRSSS